MEGEWLEDGIDGGGRMKAGRYRSRDGWRHGADGEWRVDEVKVGNNSLHKEWMNERWSTTGWKDKWSDIWMGVDEAIKQMKEDEWMD
ncbi:hypothetical protein XELAEV_18034443mg [Xenopus laevis]|uniref:Uncharacterized protein n=1 Tax=Xenopus laevis TaxID=8355 RepID=A0A974HB44_XENLA|nr:hypothetical protein XELAEV_18034443mg [Xenopus laevis]